MNITSNICFEPNETAVLLQVTLMKATAVKDTNYEIIPFHSLDLQRSGHPYVADVIISNAESIDSSNEANEASTSFTTVQRNNAVILVVEVKNLYQLIFQVATPQIYKC